MPLIASAYLVFVAGLSLGYSQSSTSQIVAAGAIVALALVVLRGKGKSGLALAFLFAGAIAIAAGEKTTSRTPPRHFGVGESRSVFDAARTRASRAIEAAFREDAPLAKALLIADRQQIPLETNDAFVAAGLVHILSISGLHVGIIAASITLLLQSARLPQRVAAAATIVTISVYVGILGAQPPAVRAAVMVSAIILGKFSQRPTSPWALLAVGAFIPLIQPRTVTNLGYQLSVAGMAALIAGAAFTKRYLQPRIEGWRLKVYGEMSTSVIATLVTAPLIAWVFGRISLVGPVANVAATPIVAVLQPMLFLALLLAPVPAAAGFVADASRPLLRALEFCAQSFAAIPGGVLEVAPSWPSIICALAAVCGLVVALVSRFPARPLIVSAACFAGGVLAPFAETHSGRFEMHVLDVGQGDAILLRTPAGRWIVVDAGRAWRGGDAGRSTVIPYIRKRGGDVAAFVLSHPHMDHVGGAATVLHALRPRVFRDAAYAGGNVAYRASLQVAASDGIPWARVRPGDSMVVDGLKLHFLAPDSAWTSGLSDANEASTVLLATYGVVRFLLAGDAEQGEEQWLIENSTSLRADVLKVGHHGSPTSSGDEFIRRVCPRIAVISVGAINSYGHPSADVVAAFRRLGATVIRTDQAGTIVLSSDGEGIEIKTAERNWELSRQSSGSSSEIPSSCRPR